MTRSFATENDKKDRAEQCVKSVVLYPETDQLERILASLDLWLGFNTLLKIVN